mgnify:CR=1 FL=1|tara:strand:- start:1361 stop:1867 length:507 start_codon:yes stop_codon:yes gene_type:complete
MSISSVTSETLQAKLRSLLPSQQGFGTDLSASDTIIPIIDLTEAAEGSGVRSDLQSALAFGSQTAFEVTGTTTTVQANTGFWRIFGVVNNNSTGICTVNLTDGATNKAIARYKALAETNDVPFDYIVFFNSGESMTVTANSNGNWMGSVRQIADINGVLVNPSGFTPQ